MATFFPADFWEFLAWQRIAAQGEAIPLRIPEITGKLALRHLLDPLFAQGGGKARESICLAGHRQEEQTGLPTVDLRPRRLLGLLDHQDRPSPEGEPHTAQTAPIGIVEAPDFDEPQLIPVEGGQVRDIPGTEREMM